MMTWTKKLSGSFKPLNMLPEKIKADRFGADGLLRFLFLHENNKNEQMMKMNKIGILLLICFVMGFLGGTCQTGSAFKAQDLNGKWTIVSVLDEPVTLEHMPFLEFSTAEKRVHGNVGCNTLSAGFEPDLKDLTAFQLIAPITTMMACIHFDTETIIVQAINQVTNVKKGETQDQVKLTDKEGKTLLVLERV